VIAAHKWVHARQVRYTATEVKRLSLALPTRTDRYLKLTIILGLRALITANEAATTALAISAEFSFFACDLMNDEAFETQLMRVIEPPQV